MKRHRGSSLLMVLVVMVVLMLGAMAAIRSTESSAAIAGNAAFAAATKQAADVGMNAGIAYVIALPAPDSAVANMYFPLRQAEDAHGLPGAVNWTSVAVNTLGNYKIQYVVERLCTGALPVTDPLSQCITETQPAAGSNKLGADVYESPSTIVFRVTVRTRGPKNSESFSQALISR
jgi:type IV pilus assembly protein PilX